MKVLAIAVLLLCYRGAASKSLVATTSKPITSTGNHKETNTTIAKPEMYYFHVESDIKFRFAHTLISTRIANAATAPQEIAFSALLPETAFISGFSMEVDGKVYNAYVKEKEEAKQVYKEAVQHGQTAAQVALTARDSNRFTVSVNVEPQKKVTFNLTYEELLSRKLGTYKHIINLDPGQIVDDFSVLVRIQESSDITDLKVPALRVSNELTNVSNSESINPLAKIKRPNTKSATITFAPNPQQQKELASDGIKGHLIVEYDVDRTSHPGQLLVNDGYFVQFFSPIDLKPLRKQVTFVLDVSGSMSGRKIQQLRQAMTTILSDLNKEDLFSIVLFSDTAQVWDPTMTEKENRMLMNLVRSGYPNEYQTSKPTASAIVKADEAGITKAKAFISQLEALSSTDIYDGLMLALDISKLGIDEPEDQKPEPIIVFLTDGQPNVKVSDPETIVQDVTKFNMKSSIFSLALGADADMNFLKKLSLRNSGFSKKIYEAADTALQLTDFYREIASPLLANVTFVSASVQVDKVSVTKHTFRRLFSGSELVVAGKLLQEKDFKVQVEGSSASGNKEFQFTPIPFSERIPFRPEEIPDESVSSAVERLWAYLTIRQLLEEDKAKDYNHQDRNQRTPEKQRALELALQYSFVTPLTSLVVVKPNETKIVDTQDASNPNTPNHSGDPHKISGGLGVPLQPESISFDELPEIYSEVPVHATTMLLPRLLQLEDIRWLSQVINNQTGMMTLPTSNKGTNDTLKLAAANEKNVAYSSCTTPLQEAGHCRHLRFCVLNEFIATKEDFIPYLCHIQSYVGVCCPDSIVPDS